MRNSEATIFLNEYDLNEADAFLASRVQDLHLRSEIARPLSERLETRLGAVELGLQRLRRSMGETDFIRLIEPLERITVSGKRALIITRTDLERSLLERDFIPQILSAFELENVRIVARK